MMYFLLYADIQAQKKMLIVYYVNGITGKCLMAAYFIDFLKQMCISVVPMLVSSLVTTFLRRSIARQGVV